MKKRQRDRRNEAEPFTFVNISTTSTTDLHSQRNLLSPSQTTNLLSPSQTTNLLSPSQTTTSTTQSALPHTVTYSKVMNVTHREIDGDHVSTINMLKNTVSSLPPITSTTSTSQILNDSDNDEVSYHPMLFDEPDLDTLIPELEDVRNQESRRQV